jgi:hypothetical protein
MLFYHKPPQRQLVCAACGKRVERKARQQMYCCRRCMRRGNYTEKIARGDFSFPPTHHTALGPNPPKNINGFNGLQGPKSRSSIPVSAPLNLLGGYRWPGAIQLKPKQWRAVVTAEISANLLNGRTT